MSAGIMPGLDVRQIATSEKIDDVKGFSEFVANTLLSRADLIKNVLDPRREVNDECGFPAEITTRQYALMYDREPLAAKVVDIYPNHCWKVVPTVTDDEDIETDSPFDKAFTEFQKGLRPEESWHKDNRGAIVWNKLKKVDKVSGVGTYGVLLLGFNDGEDLSQEVKKGTNLKVNFISVYADNHTDVQHIEEDDTSPRYGLPTSYKITVDQETEDDVAVTTKRGETLDVHWTRVIHIAEDSGESDIYHEPRMQRVYNLLHGAQKLYGAAPEGYWKMCFTTMIIESMPGITSEDIDHTAVNVQIEKWQNGLQKVLKLVGLNAKAISPQVLDPAPFIDVIIDCLCIWLEIPKRIFVGSERGELASSQDTIHWNSAIADRQQMHITPNIIVPLIDRLIHFGILPEPKEDGYSVIWPDITAPTQMQKVDVGLKITESLTKFVQGGIGDSFMTKVDFLVEVLGFDEEKAQQISDNYDEEFPDGPPMDEELFPMPGEELNDEEEEEPGMPTKTGSNPVTDKKPLPGTAKPVVPGGKNKKASPQAGAGGNKDGKKPLPVGKK